MISVITHKFVSIGMSCFSAKWNVLSGFVQVGFPAFELKNAAFSYKEIFSPGSHLFVFGINLCVDFFFYLFVENVNVQKL